MSPDSINFVCTLKYRIIIAISFYLCARDCIHNSLAFAVSQMSTIPAYRKIWDKVAANDMEALILTMEEAEARVLSKPYLMIASEISILHTFGQDCRIYILPNSFFPKQRSFVLRKGSPLIPILNKV